MGVKGLIVLLQHHQLVSWSIMLTVLLYPLNIIGYTSKFALLL